MKSATNPAASAPLRILHIGKYFPPRPGGMESFLGDLAAAQARAGHDVACLVHGDAAGQAGGVRLFAAPAMGEWLYTPLSPAFPRELARALKAHRPQLLHLHLPNPSAFWCLANRQARALPWVVQWQSDVVMDDWPLWKRLPYRVYRPLETRLLRRAGAIVASSAAYRDQSAPLAPWLAKTHIVPLGADPARLETVDAPADDWWPAGQLRVLAVGRLAHYKGHDVLLRAMAGSPETCALLVGRGECATRLRRQAAELRLGERVRFMDPLPQPRINALIRQCDVLCLPAVARSESFGMVLVEAMALGTPVIASDLSGSGVPWVVREGGHGLRVPPRDTQALAGAFGQMTDSGRRAQFGERGRRAFARTFHIDRVAEAIEAVYRQAGTA